MIDLKEFKENESKPKTFEQLVSAVSFDELRDFVKQYADSDKNFKRAFKVNFAEKNPAGGKAQYTKLIAQSLRSAMGRYGFIDYSDLILDSMVDLAEVTNRIGEVFPILDSAIRKTNSEYELVSLLQQKAGLLKSSGRIAEYVSLVHENLQHPEFRKVKLDEFLEQERYNEAEKLIEEGISISENQNHGGTTRQWKEQLLEIYKKTNQKDKYLILLRELFYASNRQFYPLLKQTIGPEKWPEELAVIISTLKKSRVNWHFLYELYAAEQMLPELLQLITHHAEFGLIKTYETYLIPKFQPEIVELYERVCKNFAARANSRGNYSELASMLKHVQKLGGGKLVVTKLLTSFREIYKRRPAMMDELKNMD